MNPKDSLLTGKRPAALGRVFRLTYSNTRPDDEPRLFHCRDAMAFSELNAALVKMGYEYGTAVYFYPLDERKLTEFPAFQPSDVLVLTTRPPLHDQVGIIPQRRKVIRAAKTELEAALFDVLGTYFEFCTRKHVQLTKYAGSCLRIEQSDKWSHVELYEYSGAEIQRFYVGPESLKPPTDRRSTIAFFLRANQVAGVGCDFVASFGMDGYGTLIWNRLVRTRFPEWLTSPRFVMAELIFKNSLPSKPISPEFADDENYVEVRLLTEPGGSAPTARGADA